MNKLHIVTYPHPALETKSQEVSIPLHSDEISLIKDMFATVQDIGVGLAAPQVGVNKQLFIVHLSNDEDLKKQAKKPDFVVINPKILFQSEYKVHMIEGCLSFPDEYWDIERSANIKVSYTTILNLHDVVTKNATPKYGTKIENLKGWPARIFLHEFDHLHGNIFIKQGGTKIDPTTLNSDVVID